MWPASEPSEQACFRGCLFKQQVHSVDHRVNFWCQHIKQYKTINVMLTHEGFSCLCRYVHLDSVIKGLLGKPAMPFAPGVLTSVAHSQYTSLLAQHGGARVLTG